MVVEFNTDYMKENLSQGECGIWRRKLHGVGLNQERKVVSRMVNLMISLCFPIHNNCQTLKCRGQAPHLQCAPMLSIVPNKKQSYKIYLGMKKSSTLGECYKPLQKLGELKRLQSLEKCQYMPHMHTIIHIITVGSRIP